MSSAVVDIGTLIVRTPGTLDGRPRIDGTRIGVDAIAREVAFGFAPERLASEEFWPHLTLAQVYAALAYYHANRAEIDADIEADRLAYEVGAEAARRQGQGVHSAGR